MSEIKVVYRPKKKPLVVLAVLMVILLVLAFWGFQSLKGQYAAIDPGDNTPIEIYIPESSNARQIASILYQNRLVRSERVFLGYCARTGLDNQLKPGHFRLTRSQTVEQIATAIAQGKIVRIAVTVPEGYTVDQIGKLLVGKGICTSEQWQEAIEADYDFAFLQNASPRSHHRLEGFLYPDTYYLEEETSARDVVLMMLKNFSDHWDKKFAKMAEQKGMDVYRTVILASIIEKEARRPEEREIISGVIQNRLKKGMLLQLCPTVYYCLGRESGDLTNADLKIDSPYNTYVYEGLPPGPIANPGAASLEAALNPQQHSYYYYVSKRDGSHHFSRTFAEHLAADQRYSQKN